VHLVTRGHSRSRDADGGHTIRSTISENPMLHANFVALCFIEPEPELLPIEVLHCGNGDFRPFSCCGLDLDPMTFIYEFYPYSFLGDTGCAHRNSLHQGFRKLSSDRQTYRQTRPKLYSQVVKNCYTVFYVLHSLLTYIQYINISNNNSNIITSRYSV